jgi:hypothetical protein
MLSDCHALDTRGKARKFHKNSHSLLAFGPVGTLLCKWLIVVNWYLNLSDDEQKAVWDNVKVRFITPMKSPKLFNEYDPENPKAIGIRDTVALCKE